MRELRQADGVKRSPIKKAEEIKRARSLTAEGEAEAIRLVNEAADAYLIGNAQLLRQHEALEKTLRQFAEIHVGLARQRPGS